jgi:hypothetical protein
VDSRTAKGVLSNVPGIESAKVMYSPCVVCNSNTNVDTESMCFIGISAICVVIKETNMYIIYIKIVKGKYKAASATFFYLLIIIGIVCRILSH